MVVPDSQRFGLLAVLGYFLASWTLVGRDPKRGVIIPLFAPPEGFTPQEVRYLDGLGTCDNTSLSAAILHLAVQRALTIQESTKGVYTLTKGKASGLDDAETRLLEALFTGGSSLKLVQQRHFVRFHRSRLQFRKRRRGLLGGRRGRRRGRRMVAASASMRTIPAMSFKGARISWQTRFREQYG
jgi:hypothetical protein